MRKKDPKWTDATIMTFGDHKGTMMKDVPKSYLRWLAGQDWIHKFHGLNLYLEDNKKVLEAEVADSGSNREFGHKAESDSFEDYQKNWKGF